MQLFDALKMNTRVHTLVMDGCNCSEEGATHIGNTLVDLPYLRKLRYVAHKLPLYYAEYDDVNTNINSFSAFYDHALTTRTIHFHPPTPLQHV